MKEVVIVSGSRTATGDFGGGLKDVPVVEPGAIVMLDGDGNDNRTINIFFFT